MATSTYAAGRTALLIVDPYNDFMSEGGKFVFEIHLALFYSYGSNPPLYPKWQAYFREHQPPTLTKRSESCLCDSGIHGFAVFIYSCDFRYSGI